MTSFSDILTVGLVLVLIFGSIALYLYTRIQQAEQKIGLLESILLELKMNSEIKSYTELPAFSGGHKEHTEHLEAYAPFGEDDDHDSHSSHRSNRSQRDEPSLTSVVVTQESPSQANHDVEEYKSAIAEAVNEEIVIIKKDSLSEADPKNYEAMTLKELQALAKSRGIMGASYMKKGPVIEALKTSDRAQANPIESGSLGDATTNSFLETSGPFLTQESQ